MTAGLGKQHALMDTFNEIWFGFFFMFSILTLSCIALVIIWFKN